MEVLTDVGNEAEAEEVHTLEDPLGEEQSVDEDRQAMRCPGRTRAYRVTAGDDPRKLEELGNSGLQAEYRFSRCQDWRLCKDADNMPMRGKEDDFLKSNRSTAKCILDQQCRKLNKNPEDVKTTLKAFKNFFNNGHMVLLKDMPQEVQKKFISKPVQHHLCWRVVNNPKSTSTPVQPVMDASTKTPGGRCLNDLVVKGRISSLNLVGMVLRFAIGKHAVAGNLSQFSTPSS